PVDVALLGLVEQGRGIDHRRQPRHLQQREGQAVRRREAWTAPHLRERHATALRPVPAPELPDPDAERGRDPVRVTIARSVADAHREPDAHTYPRGIDYR